MATTNRRGRTQCQAEKTGIVEQVTRWQDSKTEQKGETKGEATLQREPKCVAQQRESHSGHHLAIFATLPTAIVKVTRTLWHG